MAMARVCLLPSRSLFFPCHLSLHHPYRVPKLGFLPYLPSRLQIANSLRSLMDPMLRSRSGFFGTARGNCSRNSYNPAYAVKFSFKALELGMDSNILIFRTDGGSCPEVTIVEFSFGNHLWTLVELLEVLGRLGWDVIKGTVTTEEASSFQTKVLITQLNHLSQQLQGHKVEGHDVLEEAGLAIYNSLLKDHPEFIRIMEKLDLAEDFTVRYPKKKFNWEVDNKLISGHQTPAMNSISKFAVTCPMTPMLREPVICAAKQLSIAAVAVVNAMLDSCCMLMLGADVCVYVKDDGPKRSLLTIETVVRPGLLLGIIKILFHININVESAEFYNYEYLAKGKFHVSCNGAALDDSQARGLIHCLESIL